MGPAAPAFPALLQKECLCHVNRLYLLCTMLAGLLIPLISISMPGTAISNSPVVVAVQQVLDKADLPQQAAAVSKGTQRMPATQSGKPVPMFVDNAGAIVLKSMSFRIRPLTKEEEKEHRAKTEMKQAK